MLEKNLFKNTKSNMNSDPDLSELCPQWLIRELSEAGTNLSFGIGTTESYNICADPFLSQPPRFQAAASMEVF